MIKKILVTGASGFLGNQLAHVLLKKNKNYVTHLNGESSLDYYDNWNKLCGPHNIDHGDYDYIFHCTNSSDVLVNNLIDSNLIKWWRQCQPRARLITFGTDACYPEHPFHSRVYNLHTEDI